MFRRTGATLFELLLAAACIGSGVVLAISIGGRFGAIGYVGGFIGGVVGLFACVAALGFFIVFAVGLLTGIPEFPECSNGKCRVRPKFDSDYRYEMIDGQLAARCKCGTAYVKKGRRFLRLHDDGTLGKYMIWKPLRGWFIDEQ
jgi:hypothetical protein